LVDLVELFKNNTDIFGGASALEFLAVKHLLFKLLKGLSRLGKGLGNLSVSSSVAGGDEIGDSGALHKGVLGDVGIKHLGELFHLHETEAHDRGLGVPSIPEAIADAGGDGDDILQRTAQLNAFDVVDGGDDKVRCFKGEFEGVGSGVVLASDGRLAEELLGDFIGDVRTHEHGARDLELLLDFLRDEDEVPLRVKVNALVRRKQNKTKKKKNKEMNNNKRTREAKKMHRREMGFKRVTLIREMARALGLSLPASCFAIPPIN
jgi:hypothetical protein